MTLTNLLILLIKTSLISLMVGLGLGLEINALATFRHRPWLILRVLLGTCVLVPLAGLALLNLPIRSELSIGARFGIALMALCPSAPLTLRKAHLQGGDRHLAALLQVLAALVAIVSIPLLSDVFRSVHHVSGWDISPKTVALQVALVQVLPLTVGLLVRQRFPEQGARWAIRIQKVADGIPQTAVVFQGQSRGLGRHGAHDRHRPRDRFTPRSRGNSGGAHHHRPGDVHAESGAGPAHRHHPWQGSSGSETGDRHLFAGDDPRLNSLSPLVEGSGNLLSRWGGDQLRC